MPVNFFLKRFRGLGRCLRHQRDGNRSTLSNNSAADQPRSRARTSRMSHPRQDTGSMAVSSIWQLRRKNAISHLVNLFWVAVIYLVSELLIWGLSRTLHPVRLEFFASILGMILLFSLSTAAYFIWQGTGYAHRDWAMTKVDFINAHLGLGFTVPIIMLNQGEALSSGDIARIIGAFVTTNFISWISVFALSIVILSGVETWTSKSSSKNQTLDTPSPPSPKTMNPRNSLKEKNNGTILVKPSDSEQQTPYSSRDTSRERSPTTKSIVEGVLAANYHIILSLLGIFVIGIPVAIATRDERLVDAFGLWFIWVSSVKAQRSFKDSQIIASRECSKSALATMMNPVLLTVLLMIAYTRLKALAFGKDGLAHVLETFSSGTPLYALLTAAASGVQIPGNPTGWFGAGDAAVSILECGILTWGFKLSECRRQIFSMAGLVTIFTCTAAAAGNVFLSVLIGRLVGLHTPEALSFAARSTTLALAKPAVQAVGGNVMVNATLVVGNGVLGQLMYPLMLGRLGVTGEAAGPPAPGQEDMMSREMLKSSLPSQQQRQQRDSENQDDSDTMVTIATGIAIGVNGAAMGVSYLYEMRSRAAPYAALAMTVFGVMTVVFTTVDPFKSLVVSISS